MPDTQDIIRQIEKYKKQSLYYMIALILGIGISIVLFLQLQQKKNQLQATQLQLNEALEELGLSENSNDQLSSSVQEIEQLSEDLKTFGKDRWPDADLKPRQVIRRLHDETQEKRRAPQQKSKAQLINSLYGGNENTRKAATNELLKYYGDDPSLIPDLLQSAKGNINQENANTIYQILYILEQVEPRQLTSNKTIIVQFFRQARSAQLLGPKSQTRVEKIQKKMR